MSTLVVNEITGLADPTYTLLPEGIVDPNVLEFREINAYRRITIKKNSLDSSYFTDDFLPDGSITRDKIAKGAIGTDELADGCVTTDKLADRSVTTIKIAYNAVTNEEIAIGGILSQNIANDAIVTDTIRNAAVTNPKLADDCVTSRNMSPSSVDNQALQTACVTVDKLGPDVISFIQSASAFPAGTIILTARATVPNGYLFCDGSQVSREVFSSLFSAIGTMYGPGDGSWSFNLPDFRGRTAIGAGAGPGLTNRGLSERAGAESVTLTEAQMPYHSHAIIDNGHTHSVNEPFHSHSISQTQHTHGVADSGHRHGRSTNQFAQTNSGRGGNYDLVGQANNLGGNYGLQPVDSAATGIGIYGANANISIQSNKIGITIAGAYSSIGAAPAGGSQAHTNMQPYVAVNYCIKT